MQGLIITKSEEKEKVSANIKIHEDTKAELEQLRVQIEKIDTKEKELEQKMQAKEKEQTKPMKVTV